MECLSPYLCMVTVPHIIVRSRLERMLDYRGVGLERFHCIQYATTVPLVAWRASRGRGGLAVIVIG